MTIKFEELELTETAIRKLTKSLNKFYDLRDPLKKQDIKIKESMDNIVKKKRKVCFMDSCQISAIHFKDEQLENWFLMNFEVNAPATAPTIDYKNHKHESSAMYHIGYLNDVIKIMKVFSEYITIKVRADAPMELENDKMICWIAPRIVVMS